MTFPFSRRAGTLFTAAALCLACGLGHDIKATEHIREKLRARFGSDAFVSAQTVNGTSTITVTLPRKPEGDAAALRSEIEGLVKAEFPSAKSIVIYAPL